MLDETREGETKAEREAREERRERIATAALAGMLAGRSEREDEYDQHRYAQVAVRCADALIQELDKPTEGAR